MKKKNNIKEVTLALVAQARRNDERAFSKLYEMYRPFAIAEVRRKRYGLSTEEIETYAHDMLAKALMKLELFNPLAGTFKQWLRTIIANAIKDELKKNRPDILSMDSFYGEDENGDNCGLEIRGTDFTPEEEMILRSDFAFVEKLMKHPKYPAYYRNLLMRFYLENVTYEELAEMFCRKVETVRVDVHRAKEALRKMICKHGFDKVLK